MFSKRFTTCAFAGKKLYSVCHSMIGLACYVHSFYKKQNSKRWSYAPSGALEIRFNTYGLWYSI